MPARKAGPRVRWEWLNRIPGAGLFALVEGDDGFPARDWSLVTTETRRRLAKRIMIMITLGIAGGNAIAAVETLMMIKLAMSGGSIDFLTAYNNDTIPMLLALIVGIAVGLLLGRRMIRQQLDWFISGKPAGPARRRAIVMMPMYQVYATLGAWCAGVLVYEVAARSTGVSLAVITAAFVMAGASASCITYLVVERVARPLASAALEGAVVVRPVLGVRERMIAIWLVSCAVPVAGIITINVGRLLDWVPRSSTVIDVPIIVLSAICVASGIRATLLVSRSITDPLHGMQRAMTQVRRGNTDAHLEVYDSSELGVLQKGFNDMVAGLAQGQQVRDLFERHVGGGVAEQALTHGTALEGRNCFVAVLFVDIQGSTRLAESAAPETVALTLNAFFSTVADVVDRYDGFINKFEGDAALVVFGAPRELDNPAASALAAARHLRIALADLEPLKFGIGVSAGTAFAGNIGAERRYEYTVIGRPVNECARLSEVAKSVRANVVASGAAVNAAPDETDYWRSMGSMVLRGHSAPTKLFYPAGALDPAMGDIATFVGSLVKWPFRGRSHASPNDDAVGSRAPVADDQ